MGSASAYEATVLNASMRHSCLRRLRLRDLLPRGTLPGTLLQSLDEPTAGRIR
jgi:hypothetical protein